MTIPLPKKDLAYRLPIQKNSLILAAFAIVCTAIVGLVNELTKDKIKDQAQLQLLNTLHSIIEPNRYNNDITQNCVAINSPLLGNNKMHTAYIARKSGKAVAIAMTSTAPNGYNGNIELIIAINMDNSISGLRVLKHQETPGLGDKIELRKSHWITSFNNKKLLSKEDNRWAVIKDNGIFDQFTGATITPRAVVKAVKQTLVYFSENKYSLLTRPNICQLPTETKSIVDSETKNEH